MPDTHFVVHSKGFMKQWQVMLQNIYGYESYMDYLIVPSLFGRKKILSYLHFLDFTDRLSNDIDDFLEIAKDNHYHIRTLNPNYSDFKKNDTVNMRLDISENNIDEIFSNKLHQNCRRKVRQSIKRNDFKITIGRDAHLIDDFYILFAKIMHRHGTPLNDKLFFTTMINDIDSQVLIYKLGDDVVGASIIIFDGDISNLYWSVTDDDFIKTQIGYFSFWNAIKYVVEQRDCTVFDFGRSSYGGPTYKFKLQWGAKPIKVDIFSSNDKNVYSKYSLASSIWKKIPKPIVDFIGPKICKYLIDL